MAAFLEASTTFCVICRASGGDPVDERRRARVIDGSKVTGLIGSKWTFEDGGYAGNCRIIKGR